MPLARRSTPSPARSCSLAGAAVALRSLAESLLQSLSPSRTARRPAMFLALLLTLLPSPLPSPLGGPAWRGSVQAADPAAEATDLTRWAPTPATWKPTSVAKDQATLESSGWSYLMAPTAKSDLSFAAQIVVDTPAKQFGFFGQDWSVWPDSTYGDQGFEAAVLVRADEAGRSGYRVQWSHRLQELALVRFPDGGYLRSVPCDVPVGRPMAIRIQAIGSTLRVSVDGKERLVYVDTLAPPLAGARWGLGVSSGSKATFSDVRLDAPDAPDAAPAATPGAHVPDFRARKWIGGRLWIFDGAEPILLLPSPESSYINNVKLRPGYKPQLSWNSHWDVQNQGAFAEATNSTVDVATSGGGPTIVSTWRGKHVKDRFGTRTTMTVGFDRQRGVYTYDIDSQLEMLSAEPFHFRYGFDFEHHTPLDPFNWQYLIAKRRGGELYHRPVYPIDPGPQNDLETYHGLRVWYGRHQEKLQVAPAVEYQIEPAWNVVALDGGKTAARQLNTAVCAAFYDTGVSFGPETAQPGQKIRVKYRYTGYGAEEAERLFQQSKIYASPTLDPNHHYIFADEWPKLTFSKYVPLSETWIYGRTPFMTGHNQRPTYELEKNCGAGSGFAMKLGPASFAKANWPAPAPLAPGRYLLTALVKSDNAHGPGGRIELEATQAKTNKSLGAARHYVGAGSFAWKPTGFVWDLPPDTAALSIAFGNAGTGEMLITDVELRRLADGETPPPFATPKPDDQAPPFADAPTGALADYRMEEGRGFHVLNYAGGPHLDLANLTWVVDQGRPALRFADDPLDRPAYRPDSSLARHYFDHSAYADKRRVPIAISGFHGGGASLPGLTLASWIKPAAEMGRGGHGGKGDVVGYGARRFILGLQGQTAPYQLVARLNVNDAFVADAKLPADRWSHVALTAKPEAGQWRVRLYHDGKPVAEGLTTKFPSDSIVPPSIVLGAEIFYLHDAFYRGLIGRTLVLERALSADEVAALAK